MRLINGPLSHTPARVAEINQDEASMNQYVSAEGGALIPKPNFARELGVSSRTLSRWLADTEIGFPRPIIIRNRNYFERAAVELWKAARLLASLKAKAA